MSVFITLATGCAYHAGNYDRQMPEGYKTVAVPIFKNRSQEVGIEVNFTDAMVKEIERSRVGRVTNRSEAQVTMLGSIDDVTYIADSTIQGTAEANVPPTGTTYNTEYRVLVTVSIKLVRNSDQKTVWQNAFKLERVYQTPQLYDGSLNSANALYNNSARRELLQAMATDMMTEAHDRMTENF